MLLDEQIENQDKILCDLVKYTKVYLNYGILYCKIHIDESEPKRRLIEIDSGWDRENSFNYSLPMVGFLLEREYNAVRAPEWPGRAIRSSVVTEDGVFSDIRG